MLDKLRKRQSSTPTQLAADTNPVPKGKGAEYKGKIKPKAVSRAIKDMESRKRALQAADNIDSPKRNLLIMLFEDIMSDAFLFSRIELRILDSISGGFTIKDSSGNEDPVLVDWLKNRKWYTQISRIMLEEIYYGHTLCEVTRIGDDIDFSVINRTNVIPETGRLLWDINASDGIDYRTVREFGTWLLEFGDIKNYGLLNKAVPHVLFKRFAQSCWSELCEIYGIPPRVMKTDTSDPESLDRAEEMMRDMGAAAWFIIDDTEEFEWAKGVDTNGDVYNNLMSACKEELSLLIDGAVIGQDTKNGNRSKEESSVELREKLIKADRQKLQIYWNSILLPALVKIGIFPEGYVFQFLPEEDIPSLWKMTYEASQQFDVDPTWLSLKFGIPVTTKKQQPTKSNNHFFD